MATRTVLLAVLLAGEAAAFQSEPAAFVAHDWRALDAATARVVPTEEQRKTNSTRSAALRDLVRREVWTELK